MFLPQPGHNFPDRPSARRCNNVSNEQNIHWVDTSGQGLAGKKINHEESFDRGMAQEGFGEGRGPEPIHYGSFLDCHTLPNRYHPADL